MVHGLWFIVYGAWFRREVQGCPHLAVDRDGLGQQRRCARARRGCFKAEVQDCLGLAPAHRRTRALMHSRAGGACLLQPAVPGLDHLSPAAHLEPHAPTLLEPPFVLRSRPSNVDHHRDVHHVPRRPGLPHSEVRRDDVELREGAALRRGGLCATRSSLVSVQRDLSC